LSLAETTGVENLEAAAISLEAKDFDSTELSANENLSWNILYLIPSDSKFFPKKLSIGLQKY
jgi:hypothetical protein